MYSSACPEYRTIGISKERPLDRAYPRLIIRKTRTKWKKNDKNNGNDKGNLAKTCSIKQPLKITPEGDYGPKIVLWNVMGEYSNEYCT